MNVENAFQCSILKECFIWELKLSKSFSTARESKKYFILSLKYSHSLLVFHLEDCVSVCWVATFFFFLEYASIVHKELVHSCPRQYRT